MRTILSISALVIAATFASCTNQEQKSTKDMTKGFQPIEISTDKLTYPDTRKGDVVDEYFNTKVADPYRWLEDDRSAETAEWVKAENKVTTNYLAKIPFRKQVRKRMEELYNYEKVSAPFQEGDYTYYYKNDGLQNHSVLYRKDKDGKEEIFLNPNKFSKDGTTSLAGMSFSKDGSRVAYQISEGGSDWRKAIIIDAKTKKVLEDTLKNIKFSGLSWQGNDVVYYSSYDKPKGSELSAKTDQHKVYRHKLGTPQSEDQVIYGGTNAEKHRYIGIGLTEDEKYLQLTPAVSTSGNKLYIKKANDPKAAFKAVVDNADNDAYIIDNDGETLFIMTNLNAPNKRLVKVNANNPTPENWVDVIPETENVLSVSKAGDYFFANYMVDAVSKVIQFDKAGKKIRELQLPGKGTARGFGGKKEDKDIYFSFTNYATPGTSYKLDLNSGEYKEYWSPKIDFDSDQYESKQVFYTSKDGTKVPMMITYKKGMELNGNNPTLLYGYGGFDISLTPSFNSILTVWLEQGGIYAVANLRGGGEYGKKWHKAGTQQQKQNVFNDFIAAAEYLIEKKYTQPSKLAINGRSNGGLLVGATMTQRPDLFAVALPGVGVLDMLRYHTFTAGAGWAYDYGTSKDSKAMFDYLKGYSPVHNVREGKNYPATMVYTADHDDRVVPAHSFKFVSELQDKEPNGKPLLIRIDTNSGHGAGRSTGKILDEFSDLYSFMMYNMGVQPTYK